MEVSGQLHDPAALALGEESPWNPFYERLGGPQSQPECCGGEKSLFPLPGIEPQQSLCRLSYPTPSTWALSHSKRKKTSMYSVLTNTGHKEMFRHHGLKI
jgi:hypothetical protein